MPLSPITAYGINDWNKPSEFYIFHNPSWFTEYGIVSRYRSTRLAMITANVVYLKADRAFVGRVIHGHMR